MAPVLRDGSCLQWVPELEGGEGESWAVDAEGRAQGVLKVKVLAGTDLRDVSSVRISDITSFADTGSFQLTVSTLAICRCLGVYSRTPALD